MARYKGWSRANDQGGQPSGLKISPSNGNEPTLDTGPVVLGFTPVNHPPPRHATPPADKAAPKTASATLGSTARNYQPQRTKQPVSKRLSVLGEDSNGTRPDKRRRVSRDSCNRANEVSQKGLDRGEKGTDIASSSESATILGDDPSLWTAAIGSDETNENSGALVQGSHLPRKEFEFQTRSPLMTSSFFGDETTEGLDEGICDEDFLCLANTIDEGDEIDDADLLDLANAIEQSESAPEVFVPSFPKLSWNEPKQHRQTGAETISTPAPKTTQGTVLEEAMSPLSASALPSQSSPSPSFLKPQVDGSSLSPTISSHFHTAPRPLQPFLNPPEPSSVPERSPIPSVSARSRVITYFRLGPALKYAITCNQRSHTSDAIVELYARVRKSHREGHHQSLELADLFHYNRPPYLSADWVGWHGLPYFELDGAAFLDANANNKICRAIGRIEKDATIGWRMCILSIWEATWDDIDAVKGIVCI